MEPVIITLMYFLAMIGIAKAQYILIAAAVAVIIFSVKEYTVPFLISLGLMWGAFYALGGDMKTWGAISVAIMGITMTLTGVLTERKKKEEIPPEMIPYLMSLYGGYGGGMR